MVVEGGYGAQQPFCPLEWLRSLCALDQTVSSSLFLSPEVPERGTTGSAWPSEPETIPWYYECSSNGTVRAVRWLSSWTSRMHFRRKSTQIDSVNSLMNRAHFGYSEAVMLVEWDNRKYHIKQNIQRLLCTDWKAFKLFVFTVLHTSTVKQYLIWQYISMCHPSDRTVQIKHFQRNTV